MADYAAANPFYVLPCISMVNATQLIEVDRETATALERQAAARGLTVAQLVAELVPMAVDAEAIAELDRRWDAIRSGGETVPHEDVQRWLETWGTPAFKAWRDQ